MLHIHMARLYDAHWFAFLSRSIPNRRTCLKQCRTAFIATLPTATFFFFLENQRAETKKGGGLLQKHWFYCPLPSSDGIRIIMCLYNLYIYALFKTSDPLVGHNSFHLIPASGYYRTAAKTQCEYNNALRSEGRLRLPKVTGFAAEKHESFSAAFFRRR